MILLVGIHLFPSQTEETVERMVQAQGDEVLPLILRWNQDSGNFEEYCKGVWTPVVMDSTPSWVFDRKK